jgi:hypothetical protein
LGGLRLLGQHEVNSTDTLPNNGFDDMLQEGPVDKRRKVAAGDTARSRMIPVCRNYNRSQVR